MELRVLTIVVDRDECGRAWALGCPACGSGEIMERDVATRYNTLRVTGEGTLAAATGDANFDGDGFLCVNCQAELTLPAGWKVEGWD